MRTIRPTIFLTLATLTTFAQSFNPARPDSLFKALEGNRQGMGSVYVTQGGKSVYNRSFGFYKLVGANPVKGNNNTEYRIGSITKMFTAVMIMQLIEEHKLTLATPLNRFFPQVPNAGAITIDMLLNHRSGIHDFTTDADYAIYAMHPVSQTDMLARIARYRPYFNPGQSSYYSNTNYLLLGYIIEKLTNSTYAAQLHKRITAKIGLLHTRYVQGKNTPQANDALPYNLNGGKWVPAPLSDASVPGGAGAMLSTPMDMAAFIRALFKLKLCSQASLSSMTTLNGKFGRGIVPVPVADQMAYGHFAIVDGFKSTLLYLPQIDVALAICFNSANTDDNAVVDLLLNITLSQVTVAVPATTLAGYQGSYTSKTMPVKVIITTKNGRLSLQVPGKTPLVFDNLSQTKFRNNKADMTLDFPGKPGHFVLKQAKVVYDFYR